MKKLGLLIAFVFIPFYLNAVETKPIVNPNARFIVFSVQFDKRIDWPDGISQVNADGYRKVNETYAVIKLDTLTGESWLFQIGSEGSYLWVPIVPGVKYTKDK